MAKKTATTPHNTGLSIKRSGNKFTASWKIKTKEPKSQKLRYRTYNGKKWSGWTTKTLGAKSTSYSFTLAATSKIKKIHVETKINRNDTDKTNYEPSLWASSSATYKVEKPPAPTLSVSNVNANRTTFSWSIDRSDTNRHWYDRCYYRTKCTTTPDADKDWSAWTHAGTSSYTYTDTTPGTTRIFQIKARGPAGYSAVKTQRHIIGTAPIATWRKPEVSLTNLSS